MKTINKINTELFGELVCFVDENDNPLFWGKKMDMKFFSKEIKEVIIGLNIYCYNKNFESRWKAEKVEAIERDIYEQYQIFLKDSNALEDIFMNIFNEEKEEWEIDVEINTKEDMYAKIQILQVDIVKESYIISFKLENEEWALVKRDNKGGNSYFYLNPREQVEFAQMDYR